MTKTNFFIMLKIVCILCLYFHLTVANGSCSQKMFEIINGKKMEIGIYYSQKMSKSECAASCGADDNCFAATFDANNLNCKMHNTISNRTDSSSTTLLLNIHAAVLKFDCGAIDMTKYKTGVNTIFAGECKGFQVYCDLMTDGGGWTVIHRRQSGEVSFDRTWQEYENGFGNLQGEFWLGNKFVNLLTSRDKYELRVDLDDFENQHRYAKYSSFRVAGPNDKYRLTIAGYTGDAGDSFRFSNGNPFSAKDRDNDVWGGNCGSRWGAWWHAACSECNLNGVYYKNGSHTNVTGAVIWKGFHTFYSLKRAVMMIRRKV